MTYNPHANPKKLRTVQFRLELDSGPHDDTIVTYAHGYSPNRRTHLWSEANVFSPVEHDLKVEPADWIHHVALCALQDRPNTQERLLFSLTGGLGQQDPLPF